MKKQAMTAAVLAAMLGIAGCSGSPAETAKPQQEQPKQEQKAEKAVDFDGPGLSDTGAGEMYLSTAGGTSEGGNVPEIVADDVAVMTIGVNYFGGDGSVCTVYVDGMEIKRMNAANVQDSIILEGDALGPGTHKVEVVAEDGGEITIYKAAEYKVV